MKEKSPHDVENCIRNRQMENRWYRLKIFLAFVVVFYTVYSLILPAITLERKSDGADIHVHTESNMTSVWTSSNSNSVIGTETNSLMLPIVGTVYAAEERIQTDSKNPKQLSMDMDSLLVESYVKDAKLYYRQNSDEAWKNVEGAERIPGDAHFRLEIAYQNVPIDDLLAVDAKMNYSLPELLRNATTEGVITSDGTVVGSVEVQDGIVTLSFEEQWLRKQKTDTNTVLNGDFYVEAEANLSNIETERPGQIVIGGITITIDFDNNLIAKYGNVEIKKSVSEISEETDGNYLTYTLKVIAGVDGCPDVKVVDSMLDKTYIERYADYQTNAEEEKVYIGNSPTEDMPIPEIPSDEVDAPGTLVWVIGDMDANETRTLTYRVKLKEGYTGIQVKTESDQKKRQIQNTATVYSGEYLRDSDVSTLIPQAGATMSKVAGTFVPDSSGGGTITYTVWVQALASNSFTLDNVKILDTLDGMRGGSSTNSSIRQYLSYDTESFRLYQGGVNLQNGSDNLTEITSASNPIFHDRDQNGIYNDSFSYYVGALAPGESKTLTYQVKVDPGVFAVSGNQDVSIGNRAEIYSDDSRTDGNQWMNGYNITKLLNRKTWSRKLAGEKQDITQMVSVRGDLYDATGDSVCKMAASEDSFLIPAGSYQYQVVANEHGDWDISSASMKDALGNEYMQFVGYVQVHAYKISDVSENSVLTDAEAIQNLMDRTPDKTVWVKVEGNRTFQFKPAQIEMDGSYAYLLTYYARPVNTGSLSQIVVNNSFELSGSVGIGGIWYVISGVSVDASVTVEGGNRFNAEKVNWYYEKPTADNEEFQNGALYWGVRIDGSILMKGTMLRDVTNDIGGNSHYIRSGSFVGAYIGASNTEIFSKYDNLEALFEHEKWYELDTEKYSLSSTLDEDGRGTSLTFMFTEDVILDDGSALYFIIKTEPEKLPEAKRDAFLYYNKLQSSSDGSAWMDHNTTSQILYGSANIFKELGKVFTYDGEIIKDIQNGKGGAVIEAELPGAGEYVSWAVKVNYEGTLSGRYRVMDSIPDGMDVAYARIKWRGSKVAGSTGAYVPQITDLGDGWTEHTLTAALDNGNTMTSYYYVSADGKQVCWDVANLSAGKVRDEYSVDFQIVCRVTDPAVLLGGESKAFNNHVSLFNSEGTKIGEDSDGVTIQKQSLQKTGTYSSEINGGRYPFKLTLNELGEDLVEGADTITLVDELSETLTLDSNSIRVIETGKNDVLLTNWTASVEGNTLKMILPDNIPLTITYETIVNAAPGQEISIRNHAHWEGYATPSGGSVEETTFSYAAGGTVGASTSPSVTVRKMDQYDTSHLLKGAEFLLEEVTYQSGGFNTLDDGLQISGETDDDGTLTFGRESGQLMKYNTVYRLTETSAPLGYVLDDEPHYFAVVKKEADGSYPTFPAEVKVWYQSADYTYQAYNSRGEARVRKSFLDAGGNHLEKVDGTYRFGIFTDRDASKSPLQTVTITYANGTVVPAGGVAKFTNLTLGAAYYIYELDDRGSPILDAAKDEASNLEGSLAVINGNRFLVTYPDGFSVVIPEDGMSVPSVEVTNRVSYPELPKTGGMGTRWYTLSGIVMIFLSSILLLYKYKQSRRMVGKSGLEITQTKRKDMRT